MHICVLIFFFFQSGQFYGSKNRTCGPDGQSWTHMAVEPFMQPGFQEP